MLVESKGIHTKSGTMEVVVVEFWWTERGHSRAGLPGKAMVVEIVNGLEMLGQESYSLKSVTHRPLLTKSRDNFAVRVSYVHLIISLDMAFLTCTSLHCQAPKH